MASVLSVFTVTLPIFLLIALGYGSTVRGLTTKENIRGIGVFVVRFALPALIFRALSQRNFIEIMDLHYLAAYGAGSLISFTTLFGFSRLAQKRGLASSAMSGLGASCSNSGFVGYGVASMAFGPNAIVALSMTMIIENLVMLPLALGLAESESRKEAPLFEIMLYVLRRLTRNPMVLSIIAGAVAALLGWTPPAPLFRAIDLLANASTAASLFAVGGALAGLSLQGLGADVARIVGGKLCLHPILVAVVALLFHDIPADFHKSMLVFAASPCLSIFPIVAHPYGFERQAAAALMGATLCSFLTMSALLFLL